MQAFILTNNVFQNN